MLNVNKKPSKDHKYHKLTVCFRRKSTRKSAQKAVENLHKNSSIHAEKVAEGQHKKQ